MPKQAASAFRCLMSGLKINFHDFIIKSCSPFDSEKLLMVNKISTLGSFKESQTAGTETRALLAG